MEYIVIGILILIIIGIVILHIFTIKSYEKRIGQYIRRYMINDSHHNSKLNFLNLLLLETNGIKTGIKSRSEMHKDFKEEISNSLDIIKYGKELVNEQIKVTINTD